MSKYKVVQTEFRNGESLKKALTDLGVQFEASADLKKNGVILETNWTGFWGGTNQQAAIAIQRAAANKAGIGYMDGLGFRWTGKGYELIQDHHDEDYTPVVKKMNQLRQRYAYHEVVRNARAKGYNVSQTASQDGTIRLTLVRR
jgi:hypothetical protein